MSIDLQFETRCSNCNIVAYIYIYICLFLIEECISVALHSNYRFKTVLYLLNLPAAKFAITNLACQKQFLY